MRGTSRVPARVLALGAVGAIGALMVQVWPRPPTLESARAHPTVTASSPAQPGRRVPSGMPSPASQPSSIPVFDSRREWPLIRLGAKEIWPFIRGQGIKVAVLDTGIDTHNPDLANVVVKSEDLVAPAGLEPGQDSSARSHGTSIAGLIAARGSRTSRSDIVGLAPLASLVNIRVEAQPGELAPDLAARGILAAVREGAQVINISLIVTGRSPALGRALAVARHHHAVVVAMAGHDGDEQALSSYLGVLSVAAIGRDSRPLSSPAALSRRTIFAPGAQLASTAEIVPGHGAPYVYPVGGNDYAAAYVSASIALVLSANPRLAPPEAGLLIIRSATSSPLRGVRIVSPLRALRLASQGVHVGSGRHGSSPPISVALWALLALTAATALAVGFVGWPARRSESAHIRLARPLDGTPSREVAQHGCTYEGSSWDQPW